ncbi:Hypothetical protein GLP15_4525 [Giardia lamblia P15]|uniref:Uncharacterized protein n=1 Tax=Giardia intestinalis (strain P15) TaxID=658858 RepID=E1EZ05_GIAIA|nr:Hypothetical protein GLP15_4525 [Giardia lamblia P15]
MLADTPISKASISVSSALHLGSKELINSILKKICVTFNRFRPGILECSKTIKFRYPEEFFSAAMKEFVSKCARSLSLLQHFLEIETINQDLHITPEQLETLILSGESLIERLRNELETLKAVSSPDQTTLLIKHIRRSAKQRHAVAYKNALLKLLLKIVETIMKEQYPRDGMSSANILLSTATQHINNLDTVVSDARKLLSDVPSGCKNK